MKKVVGILGFGNMGSAIAERIKKDYAVAVFDKDAAKLGNPAGLKVAASLADAVRSADAVLLAVKPQDFDGVLAEIKEAAKGKLVISIAAGITTRYIEKSLAECRVVRVMPNIAAKIAQAESVLCKGATADDTDLAFAKGLFDAVGKTWLMPEDLIDAATAISGSGPAYVYFDMEKKGIGPSQVTDELKQEYARRFEEAARTVGIGKDAASLASATVSSAINLARETGVTVARLREQVTSKGGTTAAAIKVLEEGGSWVEAAVAAKKRAGELSKS